jgi:hypothetical protein
MKLFATLRQLTEHEAHTLSTSIQKLPPGNWRVLIRRKGKSVSETFIQHKDAAMWASLVEAEIDIGRKPAWKKAWQFCGMSSAVFASPTLTERR